MSVINTILKDNIEDNKSSILQIPTINIDCDALYDINPNKCSNITKENNLIYTRITRTIPNEQTKYINCRMGICKVFVPSKDLPTGFNLYFPSNDTYFLSQPVEGGHVVEFNRSQCIEYNKNIVRHSSIWEDGVNHKFIYLKDRVFYLVNRYLSNEDSFKFIENCILSPWLAHEEEPPQLFNHDKTKINHTIDVTWHEFNILTYVNKFNPFLRFSL